MVFFTCQNCGEAIKKPSVEKHKFKCRSSLTLTCMDCLKDFNEVTYKEHTSCVSEEQRYSGKDYVPKESKNSGAKKQEGWTETINSILDNESNKISPKILPILQKLREYDNLPRKKVKFQNFVRNCFKLRPYEAEEVWSVLEIALEKFRQKYQSQTNQTNNQNTSVSNGNQSNDANANGKAVKEQLQNVEDNNLDKKSNGKRKLNKANGVINVNDKNDEPVKKKKQKLQTNGNQSNDAEANEKVQEINKNDDLNKKSKNKRKLEKVNGTENNETVKEKKKKKLNSTEENNQGIQVTQNETNESTLINATDDTKFDWKAIIVEYVTKHEDGITVDKLKKKVLKKYQKHHNCEEIAYKVEKTFNKKLKKTQNISIIDNIVKFKVK